MLNRNQEPMRSFCFPQSCEDENIQKFIEEIYHKKNEASFEIKCANIEDPTIFYISVGYVTFSVILTFDYGQRSVQKFFLGRFRKSFHNDHIGFKKIGGFDPQYPTGYAPEYGVKSL